MAKKPKSARTERREVERRAVKDAEARIKLATLEPGGAPHRPIEVTSASVIEVQASSTPCAACGNEVRVDEHTAEQGLRRVHVKCPRCGVSRDLWFRIAAMS